MMKQIKLQNFKVHKNSTINFTEKVSIVTGENNSGKTSLLEAFLIFEECYSFTKHKIKTANSSNVKNGILNIGDYDFAMKFIHEFKTVRSKDYYELFYQDSDFITIEITFEIENYNLNIIFKIEKARNGTAYKISSVVSDETLIYLNQNFTNIDFFKFIKSSPISSVLQNELFTPIVQIKEEVSKGNNLNVIRNRQRLIEPNVLQNIQQQIATVLGYSSFEFKLEYNQNNDLYIKTFFKIDNSDKYQDLALLGSGALQLIEVLISVNLTENIEQKLILLDEPDSHFHRLAQKKLVDILRQTTSATIQILLTTHNEQLVVSAKSGELLHLYNAQTMEASPIVANFKSGKGKGFIENSSTNMIYNSLGISASAMKFLEAIESDKVVLVEGRSDAMYIEALQQKRETLPFVSKSNKKVSFWSLGSITDLPSKLNYWRDILKDIKNESSIWDKSILLLDLDFTSVDEMESLKQNIESKHNIELMYWKSYTIESIIIEDINIFCTSFSVTFNVDKTALVTTYIQNINLSNYKVKISSQRKQREKSYSVYSDKKLTLNDGENYNNYIKSLEQSNRLTPLIFNKDDIFKLFDEIINEFNVSLDIENKEIILMLIQNIDTTQWQTNWNDILEKVCG